MDILWNWVVEIDKLLLSGCLCVSLWVQVASGCFLMRVCQIACVCACVCCVNATREPVSLLAVCVWWREALEQSQEEATHTLSISIKGHLCYITAVMHEQCTMGHCWPTVDPCARTRSETKFRFSEGGYGWRDFHIEPLIFLRAFSLRGCTSDSEVMWGVCLLLPFC